MTDLTLMTFASDPATVLPSLALLSHRVRVLPMDAASLVKMPENTILFLDARDDLATAKTLCRLIHASGLSTPIVLVLTEGGFTVVNSQWGIADVVVATASPAEVEGRLRLVSERGNAPAAAAAGSPAESTTTVEDGQIRSGDLIVDTNGYTASLHGRPIDLAYKEFELLKYLVQHPGRVFTRAQLLQEVWGCDYYGGTRTVDVHIRRLRAKLGGEYEHLIGTVRNVGYRFDPPETDKETAAAQQAATDISAAIDTDDDTPDLNTVALTDQRRCKPSIIDITPLRVHTMRETKLRAPRACMTNTTFCARVIPAPACAALHFSNPLELLIATAQRPDHRRVPHTVTPELFATYPTARDLAAANPAQVEDIIHPLGFYRSKTQHLIGLATALDERFGGVVPRTMDELTSLPGVGRKTANVVLGNAFDIPGFPVDTHVMRVTGRLRWRSD